MQIIRIKDRVYCLMGLFRVNVLLLYKDGSRAFIRLQEKIIGVSEDNTLFTWSRGNSSSDLDSTSRYGLLADSPSDFLDKPNS